MVVQRVIPEYRVPFFNGLKSALESQGVALDVVYSAARGDDARRRDAAGLAWGTCVPLLEIPVVGRPYWQPALGLVRHSDLVVVEQANRPLLNLVLASRPAGRVRYAVWGHGANLQDTAGVVRRRLKRFMTRRAAWCFAYTSLSAALFERAGMAPERVTVVENATDTKALRSAIRSTTEAQRQALRRQLGLLGENIGLFVGGLHSHKRLPFLFESAREIRAEVPDFELLVVGAGPLDGLVAEAATEAPWIHAIGQRPREALAPFFAISRIMLMPGLVGLVLVDCFAAGLPLVTTRIPTHSPEIAYLEHGTNGLLVDDAESASAFARECIKVLKDERLRDRLSAGATESGRTISIENMVDRFAKGVVNALAN